MTLEPGPRHAGSEAGQPHLQARIPTMADPWVCAHLLVALLVCTINAITQVIRGFPGGHGFLVQDLRTRDPTRAALHEAAQAA